MITTHPTTIPATATLASKPKTAFSGHLRRLALGCLLAVAVFTGATFVSTTTAGAVVPLSHGSQVCNGTQVRAVPPIYGQPTKLDYQGRWEKVYWKADLYRWNGKTWAPYITSKPWNTGLLQTNNVVYRDSSGYRWHVMPTAQPLSFVAFNNLPRGYYMTASTWFGSSAAWQSSTFCTV